MLLARRPLDANPDAKHPGKAGKIPRGKRAFPYGIIPWLSMGQKPSIFRNYEAAGGVCLTNPYMPLRLERGQGGSSPLWGAGQSPICTNLAYETFAESVYSCVFPLEVQGIFELLRCVGQTSWLSAIKTPSSFPSTYSSL